MRARHRAAELDADDRTLAEGALTSRSARRASLRSPRA
jgi:hypothetical protein